MPVLNTMIEVATQKENLTAAVKAGADVLDRAGVGTLVQAKLRSSRKAEGGKVIVQIGFLTQGSEEPTTILVPGRRETGEA